jgi:hypothetical protein
MGEGEDSPLDRSYAGAPPEVTGEAIAWIASEREAEEMSGQTIHSQKLCAERKLLPGWPPEP